MSIEGHGNRHSVHPLHDVGGGTYDECGTKEPNQVWGGPLDGSPTPKHTTSVDYCHVDTDGIHHYYIRWSQSCPFLYYGTDDATHHGNHE